MGCDGGTIPKRHELVKGPKKVEKVDKDAELVAQWNYCALSQEILRRPIVACELGRLYNKDAVIEFLLDKSSGKALGKAASHIKSIKNVTELRLSDNPAWEGDKGNTKGDKHDDLQRARFICPVVGLEMNGRHRFCFLRCCGCVFSERALKEIKAEVCHTCGAAFQDDDVIVLNGTKEDVEMLKSRMEPQRGPLPTARSLRLTSPSSPPTALPSAPRRSQPTGSPTRPTASEAPARRPHAARSDPVGQLVWALAVPRSPC
ncbi:replication termination factor 2 [Rhinolophus ferrumequinum]|uniref:Replication termination factor 2 n=1 Tax=Rhinolophus ferrumequinum TaxID=59479 RepID=A0A7J7S9D6_RHIFE|nr:replication termination factor 2 [Rhinolophus ferrumequinum]